MMDYTLYIGVLGATLILIGFILNQLGKLKTTDINYDILNLCGGILLMLYAYLLGSVPFLILNFVWSIVSLKDIVTYFKKN